MITKPKARKFRIRRSPLDSQTDHPETEVAASPAPAAQPLRAPLGPRPVAMSGVNPAPRPQAAGAARVTPRPAPMQQPLTPPHAAAAQQAPATPAAPRPEATRSESTRPAAPGTIAAEPARSGQIASAQEMTVDAQIDAIRREGLTGRQLRMARRVAQKHGLAPTSDFDAIRLLRAEGIDPFQRATMLELVMPDRIMQQSTGTQEGTGMPEAAGGGAEGDVPLHRTGMQIATTKVPAERVQLPQTVPAGGMNMPSTDVNPAERRASEISRIQRDIASRRRRKLALLITRLSFFVFLPTLICGWYFYNKATPLYATKSSFLVMQADSQGGTGFGGLLGGTAFATQQDAIAVQDYLESRDALKRLDADIGFKAHFSQPWLDPIQRLAPDATDEAAYRAFKRNVNIGYDPTEGVVRMEVIAADPHVSAEFARHLIEYAEERVDQLSQQKREDQMKDARESLERSKIERREAQEVLIALQESTFLDPDGEVASIRSIIGTLEGQRVEKQLELSTQLANARPNRPRVDSLRTEVRLLDEELARQNRRLTDATTGRDSLAREVVQIQMAQADLATADLFLQSALQNMKQTELEANRQVRYLTTSVEPVPPDEPTYPRKFENTVLAFLVFSGIYLMVSLTASILREQVSS